jgi:hypothetical protein
MDDIPERLEWRCMLPVTVLGVQNSAQIMCVVSYTSTGLDLARKIWPDGCRSIVSREELCKWFSSTEDHHVEFVGGLHGSGRFFGYDRKTKQIRSLYAEMRELGYAVEDDE